MAKWGEGDPRWIVEERADATNVNNWHWTEKNATDWSKNRIKQLLEGFIVEDDTYCCKISEVTKLEGEATANNRKAKLIFFYEFDLKAEWKGWKKESDTKYNGTLQIPNLSEENDADELDIMITTASSKDTAFKIKEFFRKKGTKRIQDQMAVYIKELKEEYSKGLVLPTKDGQKANNAKVVNKENVAKREINKPVTVENKTTSLGVKIHCRNLTDKEFFDCEPHDLYKALTDKEFIRGFSRSDCKVDCEKNGQFEMFDGNVTGEYLDLVPNEKLVMHWRFKSWPPAHHSLVTLTLEEEDGRTALNLSQTGVPEQDFERTREGWKNFYWKAIKQTFGWGAMLF